MWTQWFQPPKFIKDHACTSAKYKSCESMSDNVIRWISGKETFTRMDETTRLGTGRAGLTHRVGVIDEELAQVLGGHEVVHYALKVMLRPRGDTKVHEKCIREMMVFPESHPAIIRPIGLCKDKKRPMLLFPLWNGGTLQKYMNLEKRSRGVISPEGVRLINEDFRVVVTADEWLTIQIFRKHRRSLVFVGIGDLGKAQSFEEVQNDFDPYPTDDPNPWPWIAPELHPTFAKKLDQQNAYMTKYSEESDIFALGWLIRELCGDFFTDMTNEEKREYNRSMYMRDLHISDAAEAHARMLKDIIDRMTWKKIAPPYRNYRRSMDYWAHYFNEQLYIDPTTCARPIERGPRAKVHPDGPQRVSRG
ncbi:hypothetical protein R1sor_005346 [Riccia sorocarpa]|uniref:Protein kinase domain-containing protein n=1 Tax=Riccia sorocarpa TaxID=122646 RepID=A0ABD3HJ98_9MARC